MKSIGFGLERVALLALDRPRVSGAVLLVIIVLAAFGITRLSFDENIRDTFASDSQSFRDYVAATASFVDPENEILLLVEGDIGTPQNLKHLQDFELQLQLVDGVDNVYSLFGLREPPDANGTAPLLVSDASAGLTPDLIAKIRAHPILGAKLLSPDGKAMIFIVTPSAAKAPVALVRQLMTDINAASASALGGTGLTMTISGFAPVRAAIVDVIKHDQIVLNVAGAIIGFLISLLILRSIAAAMMAAIPAIVAGLIVIGAMGLFSIPVTVMTTVVPALVMIFGYTDGVHLCFAWRHHRDAGHSVMEAERLAQQELAGACMLSAITTGIAFLSLVLSEVIMVRSFGLTGALATLCSALFVLIGHGFVTMAVGRYWKPKVDRRWTFYGIMERPCIGIGRFAVRFANPISGVAVILLVVLGFGHFSVPPQHSLREHLPPSNPANAALTRIDNKFDGIYPIEVVVPLDGVPATSAAGLARIAAVHAAVAKVEGVTTPPLSLASVAAWLGGGADAATGARIDELLGELSNVGRSRFVNPAGDALVTAMVEDMPTYRAKAMVHDMELAARAAGGPGVTVTGVTVINAREGSRTISNLNVSLLASVVANLLVIALAFRRLPIGALSFLPNMLPILATGTLLFLTGRGMQFTAVIAMNVAFGIAVNDTVHFINRFRHSDEVAFSLDARLVETSRRLGPVLVGTTFIIIAGLSTTLTSGLPTITLFGMIASLTLIVGLIGDLVVLPALMAGPARRWFAHDPAPAADVNEVAA